VQQIRSFELSVSTVFIAVDILALCLLFFILLACFGIKYNKSYQFLLVVINLSYLLSVVTNRKFSMPDKHLRNIIRCYSYRLTIVILSLLGCLFVTKMSGAISRLFILAFFCTFLILIPSIHWVTWKLLCYTVFKNKYANKAIILGAGLLGEKIYTELINNAYLGIKVLGFFDDDPMKKEYPVLGSIAQAKDYVTTNHVTRIYCTLPMTDKDTILDFLNFSEQQIINFYIVPQVGYYTDTPVILETAGNMPVFSLRKIPLSSAHNAFLKRMLDIAVSFTFLVTLFPVIYLLLSIVIKLSSHGSVFFVQQRTGLHGNSFRCYKFRSMQVNSEAHTKQATVNDRRVTRVGRFIRRTNIDELPQFINVLKGEMSIVGPRPHMLQHTEEYSRLVQKYMIRHFIKPGITGWAQINGFRGETKTVEQMEERIKKDIWYLENWSLFLDIEIIFKTIRLMLKGDKVAY
jgi:putative colanic acid biosynthesis UDP-glucose lipid carrier transferase